MSALALVTGASSGLGKAVHEALVAQDAVCIAISRSCPEPGCERLIEADLATAHDWPAKLAPILSHLSFARLIFFDIAAILPQDALLAPGFAQRLEEAMQVNVSSPLAIGRALADIARREAASLEVVHLSSGAAQRAIPGWGAYCASKAAAAIAWQALAAENAFVTAHIVQPGAIDTPMQARLRASGDPAAAPDEVLRAPDAVARELIELAGLGR